MSDLIYPFHFQIYECNGGRWTGCGRKPFYNGTNEPMDCQNPEQQFGLTPQKVVIELFRRYGGKAGFYLVNLRDRKYYYCGREKDSVQTMLHRLGLGRPDPLDSAKD